MALSRLDVLAIAVVVVLGLVIWVLNQPISRTKAKAPRIKCASNLKQIGFGFIIWQDDNNGKFPIQVYTNFSEGFRFFQVMSNELSDPQILVCPTDRKRFSATNFTTDFNGTRVSYFIGLDARTNFPSSFLTGDPNITNGLNARKGIVELDPQSVRRVGRWFSRRSRKRRVG